MAQTLDAGYGFKIHRLREHVFKVLSFSLYFPSIHELKKMPGSGQLLRMAWLLGFEGGETEWEKEYVVLCRSYNWKLGIMATNDGKTELM